MVAITLDFKDRKILYILTQEARTPPSVIAKQVGLSKDAVKYRIKRMEKQGVIWNYIVEMDTAAIGFYGYDLFLKFNMPPEEEHKIAEYFNNHPNILWSCSTSGDWDYFAEIACATGMEFHNITKEISAHFGEKLIEYDFLIVGPNYRITQMIESVYDGKGIDLKDIIHPTEFPAGDNQRQLDMTEKKMLGVMSENATMPIHEIAENAGLTSEVVRYRLKKLRKEGIIIRTTAVVSYRKLGYSEYIVLVNMNNLTPENEKRLEMVIKHNKAIKYAYRALGKPIMYALVNTKTVEELEEMIKELKHEFFDLIKKVNYIHITGQERFLLFNEALQR